MEVYLRQDEVKAGIGTIARLAKTDREKALMGRVLYFIDHMGSADNPKCHCWDGGRCLGTKEIDFCNCGGDPQKCDFY